MITDFEGLQTKWLILAESKFGGATNTNYLQLLAALDQGWKIVQPLHQRLHSIREEEVSFLFVLKNRDLAMAKVITVRDDPTVRKFIHENRLWIMAN